MSRLPNESEFKQLKTKVEAAEIFSTKANRQFADLDKKLKAIGLQTNRPTDDSEKEGKQEELDQQV